MVPVFQEDSYNTGSVSGKSNGNIGGIVGENYGTVTVTDTYYNSTIYTGSGIGGGSSTTGAIGLAEGTASGELGNAGSYSTGFGGFDTWGSGSMSGSGIWFMATVYPNGSTSSGITAPVLVVDMPSAGIQSGTSAYTGNDATAPTFVTMGGGTPEWCDDRREYNAWFQHWNIHANTLNIWNDFPTDNSNELCQRIPRSRDLDYH